MNFLPIELSPLRHTYPYGKNDLELTFGSAAEMRADVEQIFSTHPECKRIVVAVNEGDLDAIRECERAGLRYVLDVQLRDGKDLSLMVAEQGWVTEVNEEIEGLSLS
ncbi:hypothetical protein P4N68_06550 [Corynebacterium felinum]|uniref:Uncharacterized protein n=1 Tax=Corynebacterium felinum TaxID=131318 RepID=A0ABU2B6G3_9CORY|nr:MULTISPECIES: hypothetical protein [Corynebacterium]MDF5820740.1 hypothetical protein [Corynebacterium felinum]MDO4761629.1 hypothetical protein [Corynebacterium sp.]MDR7354211.1 hypothetical protein [Corynebacterium felinum]WJY96380.1 hypothetical protein CFELI_14045 [Corynebacterium felinum]